MTLQEYLDSVRTTPYTWGEHDCAMFAAKATDARLGTDYADKVRAFGATSARAYRKLLRDGKSLEQLTTGILGDPVVKKIEEGDVVLIGKGHRAALAVAVPPLAFAAGPDGLLPVPLAAVTRVWRVG